MSYQMAAAAASSGMQMAGQYMEGKAQAGAQKAEAKQLKQAAERQRIAAIQDENRRRDELSRLTSANTVDAVARGLDAYDQGSTENVIQVSERMGEQEIQQHRSVAAAEARKTDYAAKVKKAQARQTMVSTYFKMGSTAMSTAGKMYGMS